MGIKIENISVKDLGPIKKLDFSFGIFNLIFSQNEKGKTFLTEFIIRSLFKNISRWNYLRKGGSGKISVSGLEKDGSLVDFSPISKKKLEDFWQEQEKGLPASIVKLLVVRGGEAGIEDSNGGVNKFLIKEVLSGINILDKIDDDKNISRTIKAAQISNGQIIISNQGEGKRYSENKEKLDKLKKLFEEIENKYVQGVVKTYKQEKEFQKNKLDLLEKAKKHLAWEISEKLKTLQNKLNESPDNEILNVEQDISLFNRLLQSFNDKKKKFEQINNNCKEFNWLEKAFHTYKELLVNKPENQQKGLSFTKIITTELILTLFGLTLIFTGFYSSFKFFFIIGILFIVALIAYSVFVIKKQSSQNLSQIAQFEEINNIKEEFKKKLKIELTDVALLEETLEEQKKYYNQAESLKDDLDSLEAQLDNLFNNIIEKTLSLYSSLSEPLSKSLSSSFSAPLSSSTQINIKNIEDCQKILKILKENNAKIRNDIETYKETLIKLNVDPTDYLIDFENENIVFSFEQYEKTLADYNLTDQEILSQEQGLGSLKNTICSHTGDDPSISWDELMESLRNKIWQVEEELSEINSSIAAGVIVHNVIDNLREEEDLKIKEGLQSQKVLSPLMEITKRYNKLYLDEDKLIISDNYNDFDLRDLSTGAREQVMLALRIGFSSSLLGNDTLFLLLDDAFQHSDWQKREILIEKLADIAKTGWQIIYFTMDNHIAELFEKAGKNFMQDEYRFLDIGK